MKFLLELLETATILLPNRLLDRLGDEVFVNESVALPNIGTCDILFVPGGDESRLDIALDLFKRRKANYILVSGGIGPMSKDPDIPEAVLYQEYLMEHGVPKDRILVEPNSRNTVENVKFSVRLLETLGFNLKRITILVATNDYHLRRTLCLLFSEILVPQMFFWVGTDTGEVNRKNWKETSRGRFIVVKEYFRLRQLEKRAKRQKGIR